MSDPTQDSGEPVPDEGTPDALSDLAGLYDDEAQFGGEAAVRPDAAGYTGSLRSRMPETETVTPVVRELERRVEGHRSPVFPLEHFRRVPLEFLWKRYRRFAMRDRSEAVDAYGYDPVFASRLEPGLDLLCRRYFRVEVVGAAHLPRTGPAILVANHSGPMPWDALVLMHAVRAELGPRRKLRPLVEDAVFHFPYVGVALNRLGAVRACPENAERMLAEGALVAVFPEGEQGLTKLYRDRRRLGRFGRGGFVKLALRAGVPIIPVAVTGAQDTAPTLARLPLGDLLGLSGLPITPTFPWLGPLGLVPLPAKWRIQFGRPLVLADEHGPEAAEDRILVATRADQVRAQIQKMIEDMATPEARFGDG